ncbi:hypothetical protein K2X89_04610, partial [Myxococcota bacterium]|nr:hypothetical protein [Myxococcota bacterium]
MSSVSSPTERTTPTSNDSPIRAVAPLAFLRRLADLTHVPQDPAALSALDEHFTAQPTWQQTLEVQCAPLGMRTVRVIWSLREAFGAATRGCALVSTRLGAGGAPEL